MRSKSSNRVGTYGATKAPILFSDRDKIVLNFGTKSNPKNEFSCKNPSSVTQISKH